MLLYHWNMNIECDICYVDRDDWKVCTICNRRVCFICYERLSPSKCPYCRTWFSRHDIIDSDTENDTSLDEMEVDIGPSYYDDDVTAEYAGPIPLQNSRERMHRYLDQYLDYQINIDEFLQLLRP